MRKIATHLLFIAAVLGGGLFIGFNFMPGDWYQSLAKPPFNPPNWIFAPVWSILYILIGVAGARTFLRDGLSNAFGLWVMQLILNFLWSPAFFGARNAHLALAVIVPLLATILAFIALRWRRDRVAALLFVPYAAWVGFATLLNASIVWLN
ncbi:MAG: sensor histidine kinase [Rhizobiales bacterium 63-7]|nr:tryptophan-rich sensory protein [Hyphomicrobiales bacterium]OJU71082.1 MAG: sensor histidine kinase [Rhizobiales bacterium 63-7]